MRDHPLNLIPNLEDGLLIRPTVVIQFRAVTFGACANNLLCLGFWKRNGKCLTNKSLLTLFNNFHKLLTA
jgi:hypothetical protein